MNKYIAVASVLISATAQADSFDGCYSRGEVISSVVSESSEKKISFIKITKIENSYYAKGIIWGANYHICHIGSPDEGSSGPLSLKLEGDKLVYTAIEPEYNINCKLDISFQNGSLHLSDKNYDCSKYIFSCGSRVDLNDIELSKSLNQCTENNR